MVSLYLTVDSVFFLLPEILWDLNFENYLKVDCSHFYFPECM